jgi:flagellar protein FliL
MKEASNSGGAATAEAPAAHAPAPSGGGIAAWLPLLGNIILMPLIAYAVAVYVLLPRLNSGGASTAEPAAKAAGEHGAKAASEKSEKGEKGEKGERKGAAEGSKVAVALSKQVMVNVSGSMGTRFLLVSITIVGTDPGLKTEAEANDVQLRDAAASVLATKTLADLEKPGARNLIRSELIAAFNNVLAKDLVTEILFPEFAIQ